MCFLLFFFGNPKGAIRQYKKATEFDPNFADALMLLGYQLSAAGKNLNKAQSVLKKVETFDSLTPIMMGALGFFHMFSDFSKAIESWKEWQLVLEEAKSPFFSFSLGFML